MYPNIQFMTKNWSDLCNFYSKTILWKYFLLFFAEFEILVFYNNIVKTLEKSRKKCYVYTVCDHNAFDACNLVTPKLWKKIPQGTLHKFFWELPKS